MAMTAGSQRCEALALSERERAMLAADLLASLDEDTETARLVWAEEIERRTRAVMAGASQTEQWETVQQRLADELAG
jgi:putative addiction module component (TIGR02574 family)